MNKNYLQIKEKLSKYPITSLSKSTGFQKREPLKITGVDFITGVFKAISKGDLCPKQIAEEISFGIEDTVSRKAVDNRLHFRQEAFSSKFLDLVLNESVRKSESENSMNTLFSFFEKVLVHDSTCLKMPNNLFDFFPGPYSAKGEISTARIQLALDLLSEKYESLTIQSYRDNDQKHAAQIAKNATANSLHIFDLGYMVLGHLEQINANEGYFLSRYRFGTKVFSSKTGKPIDLLKELQGLYRRGINHLDWQVLLGATKKVKVRIIAQRVSQSVLTKRREKARNDRHKDANHSEAYFELLGWTILVTNVPKEIWTIRQAFKAYGFRWRVEIVFKCWKSHFDFDKIFSKKKWLRPAAAKIYLNFLLAWIIIFFANNFRCLTKLVWEKHQKWLSILKFADFVKEHFEDFCFDHFNETFLTQVAYFCSYQKRKDRLCFFEYLYMI